MSGRRTKEAELLDFAAHIGAEPELVREFIGAAIPPKKPPPPDDPEAEPPTAEQIRDEFLNILYANRHDLKGIALVQALKALATLAEHEKPAEEAGDAVSLLDGIAALPKDHAVALLRGEIERLDAVREGYFAALNDLLEAE